MHLFARLMIAGATGFVGARYFWLATGIEPEYRSDERAYITISGFVVAGLTLVALVYLEKGIRALVALLGRTKQRPPTSVAIALLVAGSCCLIAGAVGPSMGASATARAAANQVEVAVRFSLFGAVATILIFSAGFLLIGLGIWAAIPASPAESMPVTDMPTVRVPD